MFAECNGFKNWFNCLNCKFLSTYACPFEGEDPIDKITHKIKMLGDQKSGGSAQELFLKYMNE